MLNFDIDCTLTVRTKDGTRYCANDLAVRLGERGELVLVFRCSGSATILQLDAVAGIDVPDGQAGQ